MKHTMHLPELGENISRGLLVAIHVTAGDTITKGQILFEVETDKVVVEVPAQCDGRVDKVLVEKDTTLNSGDALAEIDSDKTSGHKALPPIPTTPIPPPTPASWQKPPIAQAKPIIANQRPNPGKTAPAGPASRNLARRLGIDIHRVIGSGKNGRISKQDVINHAKRLITSHPTNTVQPLPDETRFGPTYRQPVSSIQLATARKMSNAWQQIPHAWLQADIDITTLEKQRKNSAAKPASLNAYLLKAIAHAVQQLPRFNASWDTVTQEIIYRQYININLAVDTPKGLLVPVIRKVDEKSLHAISDEIGTLAKAARNNHLSVDDMHGGGITLSNLGGFGLRSIQPVVNWPQVAIVGIASAQWRQYRDNKAVWQERLLLPITLGFDHRIINGADGARFIDAMRALLEKPGAFSI